MFAQLENLKLRALALRSTVYNEKQMTALELAAMNAKKTNEIIDVVNDLCELVNGLSVEGLAFEYDEKTETLRLAGKAGEN